MSAHGDVSLNAILHASYLPSQHEALQGGVRVTLIASRTPVRAECNYKIRIECEADEEK
jgi:hypothetical protein